MKEKLKYISIHYNEKGDIEEIWYHRTKWEAMSLEENTGCTENKCCAFKIVKLEKLKD